MNKSKMNYEKVVLSNQYRKTTLSKECRDDLSKYVVNFIVDCILIADSYSVERNAVIKRVLDTFSSIGESCDFSQLDINKWLMSKDCK